jgi:signal transduction histidine kinase
MATDSTRQTDLSAECLIHDLNNVFQTLLEAAELLSSDPKWEHLSGTIFHTIERGRGIVQSFNSKDRVSIDLAGVVDHAVQFARDFAQTVQGCRLEFVTSVDSGLRIQGQPWAWERVLINLFLNSANAMPEGGVIEVSARRVPGFVQVEVADHGSGIAEEILPEIFRPRFSTHDSRGLGLHIVETIVRDHEGEVTASNRADRPGARFTIRVPVEGVLVNRATA